jgi:Peptidase C13 family
MRHLSRTVWTILLALALAASVPTAQSGPVRQRLNDGLLGRQPQLLERTLQEIEPPSSDRPNLYFVGFAGFGREAVFKREVLAVQQLFDERFNTRGKSIPLINHPSTDDSVPLATLANLERTLRHVGGLLDPGRDMLFLFLTSHGERGRVAVEMPGLAMRQLTPQRLKEMLDRAGIARRVIVVSACHAGSFIPTLTGPTSLVIAAARADRSSFGCEDRRRWTYFGDAYFNHGLREESSFRKAFERARRLIVMWEKRDGLVPSLPQIAGGEALPEVE